MNPPSAAGRSRQLALLCMFHHAVATGSRAVLPLIALERGASQAMAGSLVATQALAPAILGLPLGMLISRKGTRWSTWLGTLMTLVALLALATLWGVGALFPIAATVGLGFALTLVSVQRELGDCVEEGDARAYDHFSMALAVSSCIGPLLAGALMASLGAGGSALGMAMLTAAAIGGIWLSTSTWSDRHRREQRGSTDSLHATDVGVSAAARALLSAEVVISLLWNAIAMVAILRSHSAGWTAAQGTAVVAALGAGVAAARFFGPWVTRRMNDIQLIRLSMAAAGTGLASFVLPLPWLAVCSLQFCVGLGLGVSLRPVLSELHRRSNPESHTRVLAVRQMLLNLCAVAGPAAMGVVAGGAWGGAVFAALGAVAIAAACVLKV